MVSKGQHSLRELRPQLNPGPVSQVWSTDPELDGRTKHRDVQDEEEEEGDE